MNEPRPQTRAEFWAVTFVGVFIALMAIILITWAATINVKDPYQEPQQETRPTSQPYHYEA